MPFLVTAEQLLKIRQFPLVEAKDRNALLFLHQLLGAIKEDGEKKSATQLINDLLNKNETTTFSKLAGDFIFRILMEVRKQKSSTPLYLILCETCQVVPAGSAVFMNVVLFPEFVKKIMAKVGFPIHAHTDFFDPRKMTAMSVPLFETNNGERVSGDALLNPSQASNGQTLNEEPHSVAEVVNNIRCFNDILIKLYRAKIRLPEEMAGSECSLEALIDIVTNFIKVALEKKTFVFSDLVFLNVLKRLKVNQDLIANCDNLDTEVRLKELEAILEFIYRRVSLDYKETDESRTRLLNLIKQTSIPINARINLIEHCKLVSRVVKFAHDFGLGEDGNALQEATVQVLETLQRQYLERCQIIINRMQALITSNLEFETNPKTLGALIAFNEAIGELNKSLGIDTQSEVQSSVEAVTYPQPAPRASDLPKPAEAGVCPSSLLLTKCFTLYGQNQSVFSNIAPKETEELQFALEEYALQESRNKSVKETTDSDTINDIRTKLIDSCYALSDTLKAIKNALKDFDPEESQALILEIDTIRQGLKELRRAVATEMRVKPEEKSKPIVAKEPSAKPSVEQKTQSTQTSQATGLRFIKRALNETNAQQRVAGCWNRHRFHQQAQQPHSQVEGAPGMGMRHR